MFCHQHISDRLVARGRYSQANESFPFDRQRLPFCPRGFLAKPSLSGNSRHTSRSESVPRPAMHSSAPSSNPILHISTCDDHMALDVQIKSPLPAQILTASQPCCLYHSSSPSANVYPFSFSPASPSFLNPPISSKCFSCNK